MCEKQVPPVLFPEQAAVRSAKLSWKPFGVEHSRFMASRSSIAVLPLLVCGCGAPDPVPLAGNEMPYFPNCVAREDGGYQERRLTRLSWFSAEYISEPTIIDANCIAVEP